jgi:beta-glucanase (GH16 family)
VKINSFHWLAGTAMIFLTSCGGGNQGLSQNPDPLPPAVNESQTTPPSTSNKPGWTLVWSDEFDTNGLPDPTKWAYDTDRNRAGWYNNEKQYYAANRLENSRVENGKLIITARKERLISAPDYGGQNYTSARLVTRGLASWTYGFFEIRAKLPCGQGTWPAIWTLGVGGPRGMVWPDDGEIDIMEFVGSKPSEVFATVHNQKYNWQGGIRPSSSSAALSDACTNFHNYQLTWTPEKISIGVDDRIYFNYINPKNGDLQAWPFDKPQYLLLNIAIGGDLGGKVDDNIFPVEFQIEHVRIYKN